ncbi:MAG: MFS transporter [Lachnospirales bacterium]
MKYYVLLVIIYIAFISLGLPDGIIGASWPKMRLDFSASIGDISIITTMSIISSTISCILSSKYLERFGVKIVTFFSCMMTAFAILGYSFSGNFIFIILCAIPYGAGAGAVDSGLNNFVAENYSSKHMNWLHCFWGLGASLGTFILAITINNTWRFGFRIISLVQFFLAFILFLSIKLNVWNIEKHIEESPEEKFKGEKLNKKIYQYLAILMFFLYTGVEYSMILWITTVLVETKNLNIVNSTFIASSFYFFIMTGRFLAGIIVEKIGNKMTMRLGCSMACTGLLVLALSNEYYLIFLGSLLFGLGLAPLFPCLMHETPRRYSVQISRKLIGYQVAAAGLGAGGISFLIGRIILINTNYYFITMLVILVGFIFINEFVEFKLKDKNYE